MPGNPLVDQGTLNRLRGSVVWNAHSELNVTAPYLGDEAIRLALEGEATNFLPTLTGVVTSPEPYQMIGLTMNLLKTQPLANAYKKQMEFLALIGDGTVRSDAKALGVYQIINCSIQSVRELNFNGRDAGYVVSVKGYYAINSSLFDG
jgi:hypothetical protein